MKNPSPAAADPQAVRLSSTIQEIRRHQQSGQPLTRRHSTMTHSAALVARAKEASRSLRNR